LFARDEKRWHLLPWRTFPTDTLDFKFMKHIFSLLLIIFILLLWGCSTNTPIATNFILNKGFEITFHNQFSTSYPDKELIFELNNIPDSKKDRDFSDYISVTLTDINGKTYTPEKIWDVNGSRMDIIAICNNIPKSTKIITIKIVALKDFKVSEIRWWNGKLH
jgi:hypothetical protein